MKDRKGGTYLMRGMTFVKGGKHVGAPSEANLAAETVTDASLAASDRKTGLVRPKKQTHRQNAKFHGYLGG